MAEMTNADSEALAARLTDPATPLPKAMDVLTGDAAAAAGRAFLVSEYETEEGLDTVLREAGRAEQSPSPA
ncbi:hypothetical protein ACEXQD_06530 [Herbiconiux sp. P15]|uniref:hypothetical protein n=1 Tax=Herbiconiux liukaitaii TaxID=3342799 RepID=UPI0035B82205